MTGEDCRVSRYFHVDSLPKRPVPSMPSPLPDVNIGSVIAGVHERSGRTAAYFGHGRVCHEAGQREWRDGVEGDACRPGSLINVPEKVHYFTW